MAKKLYEESNIQAVADAIRAHTGETKIVDLPTEVPKAKVSKTANATSFTEYNGGYGNDKDAFDSVTVRGASKLKVKMAYQTEDGGYDYVQVMAGNTTTPSGTEYGGETLTEVELEIAGDTVTFYFHSDESYEDYLGYYAEVRGYDADGNPVANEDGSTETIIMPTEIPNTYKVSEMASAISEIKTCAEIPAETAATAIDIAKDKQAEVNGELVTGTVQTITGQYNTSSSSNAAAGGKLYLDKTFSSPIMFRKGSYIELTTNLSNLGDAETDDVVAGKTFTSTAGKKATGTHVCKGSDPVEEKDVNFYDYDGTLLYSYTVEEAHALTELPALPSHDGLVCQGWNWTLAQVKAVPKAANVGAAYITDDGKTRLYLEWGQDKYRTLTIHFTQTVANGVTIDWGDGSPTETVGGTGAVTATHNFTQSNCVMTLFPTGSCKMTLGRTSSELNLFGGNGSTNKTATNALKKIEVGQNVTALNQHCLYYAGNAETVTIPLAVSVGLGCMRESGFKCIINTDTNGYLCPQQFAQFGIMKVVSFPPNIVTMGAYAFYNAPAIENANFVANFQTLGNYGFSGCRLLRTIKFRDSVTTYPPEFVGYSIKIQELALPSSLTTISANAFYELYTIQQLVIPSKVTSIAANAFARMYGLGCLKFLPTTPPTVANANAFTGIPTTCIVEVPKGTLATYQAATNYGGIAAQMVEASS